MFNLNGMQGLQGMMGMGMNQGDSVVNDTSEEIHISCLALLKMLKHGIIVTRKVRSANGSHGINAWRIY